MENNQYTVDLITAMAERTIKRLWIIVILLILLLVGTNAGWIWYESQWVDDSVTQEVETGTGDAYVAGIGDVNYGTSTTDSQTENP